MQYLKTLLTFSLLGLMTDTVHATTAEESSLLSGIQTPINNGTCVVETTTSPLYRGDFSSSIRDLNDWHQANVMTQPSKLSQGLSFITSSLVGILGSAVLIKLSYEFGDKTVDGHVFGGFVVAALTSISPVCGFSRINKIFTDQFFLEKKGYALQDLCTPTQWVQRLVTFLGSSSMALPFAYATHMNAIQLKFMNSYSAFFALDLPAYLSNSLVYALMSQNMVKNYRLHRSETNSDQIITEANKGDIEAMRKFLILHFKTLSAWYTKDVTDEAIADVYQKTGFNQTEIEPNSQDHLNATIAARPIDVVSLRTQNLATPHSQESVEIAADVFVLDQKFISLIKPDGFTVHVSRYQSNPQIDWARRAVGVIGSTIAVAGSYYLADMGQQQSQKIGFGTTASYAFEAYILLFASLYGSYTGYTTSSSLYDLCNNIFNKCKKGVNTQVGEGSTGMNIVLPIVVNVLAAARATPNVELSINFLGKERYDYFLATCTAINVFALSVWSLNIFFKTLFNMLFQAKIQQKRSTLVDTVDKLLDMAPALKDQHVRSLFDTIAPQGVVHV